MNGLKVRKLAAVVAGAALLGTAIAPMASALTGAEVKSVVYDSSMSPVVNIVVGQNAAVTDGVWAGNIARKVVEKAVTTQTYNGTGGTGGSGGSGNVSVTDLKAVLSLGGTVTITGGKTFDSTTLNSVGSTPEYQQDIGKDPLSFLTDKSYSYKYNDTTTNIDVKETIGVKLNPKFDTSTNVKDLSAVIDSGDLNYVVNLGSGIPIGSTATATANFTDGDDDNIRIPFFGKNYLVQRIAIDSSRSVTEVRLIEDKSKQTFLANDTFTLPGKGTFTGKTMTVLITSIVASGPAASSYQVHMTLKDDQSNTVDTQTVSPGNFVTFLDSEGNEAVSGDIYVDSASVNAGTNEGTTDLLVGTTTVRLKAGENYPYNDQMDSENLTGPYQVSFVSTTDTNKLQKIVIKNSSKTSTTSTTAAATLLGTWKPSVFNSDNPLYSGDDSLTDKGVNGAHSIKWLDGTGALGEGFFSVTFDGFKNDQALSYLQVGNNLINFRDQSDSYHSVPMWQRVSSNGITDGLAASTNSYPNGVAFNFDNGNKTLYYDVNTMTQDFNVTNGTILNGQTVYIDTATANIQTDLGLVDLNNQPTAIVLNGVTYTFANGDSNRASNNSYTLRADGFIRFAKASLNSSTSSSDFMVGTGGTNTVTQAATGLPAATLANVFFYDDANVNSTGTKGISSAPVLLNLSGDNYKVAYGYTVFESDTTLNNQSAQKGVYLFLYGNPTNAHTGGDGQAIPNASTLQKNKPFAFLGTDTGEDGTPDTNYYVPEVAAIGQNPSSDTVYGAQFLLDENNSSIFPTRFYIDTRSDDIPLLGGSGNKISTPVSDVNYGWSVGMTGLGANGGSLTGQSYNMSTDSSNPGQLLKAYTDFGTKFDISDGQTFQAWTPENQYKVSFHVTGEGTSTEVLNGEEKTVDKGGTATFSTGTQVTVKDITYTANVVPTGSSTGSTTVTSGTGGFTYNMPAPLNGNSMVYTTANLPAGSKIIVGGPLVNSLASSVADQLNAAGDKVAMVSGSNIIVAGYTADDTGAAAQMLIDALDSI